MVFSGHEHIFAYTFPMLNKQKNESGITYVIGSAGGNKSSNPDNYTQAEQKKWYQENKDFFEYYSVRNLSTCSIDVDGSTIKVTLIDEQGNEVKSFERTGGVEKAKKYANSVVNEKSNTSNLNERYYDEVNNIKDEFNKKMNNATSKLDSDNARKEASDKLDLIIEKNKACKEVENRYDSSKYYDPQLQELNNIIKNGINSIDSAIEINDIKDKQTNTFVAIGKVPTKTIIDNKTNDLLIFSQDIILKDLSTKQEEDYTKFVDEKMNELKQVVSTIDLDDKYNQLTIEIETYYNELTAKKSGCKNAKDSIIYIIAALSLLSISLLFGFKKKD